MAKRRMMAKFWGGPKDGDTFAMPQNVPDHMYFFSRYIIMGDYGVHCYELTASYSAAGYDIHVYVYTGMKAAVDTTASEEKRA